MKHKRQHTNGIVSKEERTIRIRQLLGSPTTPIRIPKQPDDDLPTSSDVIKTSDEDMMVNDEEGRRRAPKFAKAKKKFAKSGSGSDLKESRIQIQHAIHSPLVAYKNSFIENNILLK